MPIQERIAKPQKIIHHRDESINCDLIVRSVAEVERVWSISIIPRMFEALLFLRYN